MSINLTRRNYMGLHSDTALSSHNLHSSIIAGLVVANRIHSAGIKRCLCGITMDI